MLDIFISSITMAAGCFALFLLTRGQSKSPLVIVLLCLVFFSAGAIVFKLIPAFIQLYISLIPAMVFLFLPAFWLYHDALISTTSWHWRRASLIHFVTLPVMLLLGITILIMPQEDFMQMFFSSEASNSVWVERLSILFFISVLSWCLLSCAYVMSIFKRTLKYRQQIKLVYADESGRDLNWIGISSGLIIFTWGYGLAVLAFDNKLKDYGISETGVLILLAIIMWLVALNGVKQRPGFEDTQREIETIDPEPNKQTYERSALSLKDFQRISSKLSLAVSQDNIHLDPDLNLLILSKHLGERSQYISQTLSQHLSTTFFDFVNRARINEAKQLLSETNDSVLDIAYATGFNSRSSFYKSFRQHTNQTPTQYRSSSHVLNRK